MINHLMLLENLPLIPWTYSILLILLWFRLKPAEWHALITSKRSNLREYAAYHLTAQSPFPHCDISIQPDGEYCYAYRNSVHTGLCRTFAVFFGGGRPSVQWNSRQLFIDTYIQRMGLIGQFRFYIDTNIDRFYS